MHTTDPSPYVTRPSATIVVVPRERFSHSRPALEALYANTSGAFDVVYVDGNSPPHIAEYLREASARHGFELIRVDRFLSPNQARNLGARDVRSDYVVFIDNDCEPTRGWLDALLRCATETGAAAVTPLYLEGKPGDDLIHMAGGTAHFLLEDGERKYVSEHLHAQRRVREVELARHETELLEFHCVLVKTSVLRDLGLLDEELLSNHEHEDLALSIREAGGRILFEPTAHVTYATGPLDGFDIEYAKLRWSEEWNRRSARHFAQKWRLQQGWGVKAVAWCNAHREKLLGGPARPAKPGFAVTLGRAVRAMLR